MTSNYFEKIGSYGITSVFRFNCSIVDASGLCKQDATRKPHMKQSRTPPQSKHYRGFVAVNRGGQEFDVYYLSVPLLCTANFMHLLG